MRRFCITLITSAAFSAIFALSPANAARPAAPAPSPTPAPEEQTGEVEAMPSAEDTLKAIKTFQRKPLSSEAGKASEVILVFADKSEQVLITLADSVMPWVAEKSDSQQKIRAILLTAYVAGNIKSQLDKGKCENDSYAGVLQAMETYDQLRAADKSLVIPELDKFKALETEHKLKHHLERELLKEGMQAGDAVSA